jgi:hypothetical protein
MTTRALLVLFVLAACARTPERLDEVDGDCRATSPPNAAATMTGRLQCPHDAALAGAVPPEGSEAWCERDGVRHGATATFFPVGTLRSQGAYADGDRDGLWQEYFADGRLREESEYRRGKPTGRWTKWAADGVLAREAVYSSDRTCHVTEYHRDGSRAREGVEVDGLADGIWHEWNSYGLESRVEYDRGTRGGGRFEKIGFPECDEYVIKFGRCIDEHVPEAARPPMRDARDATIRAWLEAAQGPARDRLPTACAAALNAARMATNQMGCEW